MRQLESKNGCFVSEYLGSYPTATPDQLALVMGYYERGALPALHALAENFLVCDRWFSSLPGPTWPNRLFIHSGTSNGYVDMPTCIGDAQSSFHTYDQPTIYQRLEEQGVSWKIYHHGMPQSLVLEKQHEYKNRYHPISQFISDVSRAEQNFPAYSFIEPAYNLEDQNDQHPPSDIRKGDALLVKVYNAIRANSDLWNSTLLVVLYDEHGGFYDHVVPPAAVAPDSHTDSFAFNSFGLRVPAVLISPWVDATVSHQVFDHTSVLKYAIEKWQLSGLTRRVDAANSIGSLLDKRKLPRTDTPETVEAPLPTYAESLALEHMDCHDQAWVAFGHYLERLMQSDKVTSTMSESISTIEAKALPKQEALAQAKERVLRFLSTSSARSV
jgi:hypothetical protein